MTCQNTKAEKTTTALLSSLYTSLYILCFPRLFSSPFNFSPFCHDNICSTLSLLKNLSPRSNLLPLGRVPCPSPFRVKHLKPTPKPNSIPRKMDSVNIVNLKIEKTKKNLRYRRITALFRFVEFLVLLLMISRFSLQLPGSFKFTGEYFKYLMSPQFVFLIGNAIVVILVVKSGRFCSGNRATTDFCEEYVANSVKNHVVPERVSEDRIKADAIVGDGCNYGEKRIDRSYSENLDRGGGEREKLKRQLRRTVTEGRRKSTSAVEGSSPAEQMSNEEFRRRVEDFIARQQKSLREEEFPAIVTY